MAYIRARAGALFLVGDDHETPALEVRPRRGLKGNLDAVLDDLRLHGAGEVQALAYASGGREQVVYRGKVHCSSSFGNVCITSVVPVFSPPSKSFPHRGGRGYVKGLSCGESLNPYASNKLASARAGCPGPGFRPIRPWSRVEWTVAYPDVPASCSVVVGFP